MRGGPLMVTAQYGGRRGWVVEQASSGGCGGRGRRRPPTGAPPVRVKASSTAAPWKTPSTPPSVSPPPTNARAGTSADHRTIRVAAADLHARQDGIAERLYTALVVLPPPTPR
uniref:Uncharacterized protein n=1 Tax=Oryza sativa subsp. japonica TaxID=39947 RepID=Q6YS87_ORYSJ|nr:hypothetical protein [Oryza sativa Japonica Group]BAD31769.1 hypothetical protein [Oryza sativa Japonica Group]